MSSAAEPSKVINSVTKEVSWKVPNYSKTLFAEYKNGDYISSKPFTVSCAGVKTKWILRLYPNGNREECKSNVSLFLHSPNANETDCIDFKMKFKLGVVKKNRVNEFLMSEAEGSKEQMKNGLGVPQLLSHTNLFDESKGYVVNQTLTIVVLLKVEYEGGNDKYQTEAARSPALREKMENDIKEMFQNDAFADFKLEASDGEVLKAHKVILAARSPVFYAMLKTDMQLKDGSVDVPDFDSKLMKEILRYIYCNEIEGLKQIAPKLIFAAEKYQLEDLKNICLQEILSTLEPQNVVESLKIAHQVSKADELLDKCITLIMDNYGEVSQCPSWKDLPKELMAQIIDTLHEQRYSFTI